MISTWAISLNEAFREIAVGTAAYFPKLIIAVVVLVVGWAFAVIADKVVAQIVRATKIDGVLRGAKIDQVLSRAGFNLDVGKFLGGLVKWFIIVCILVASFDVLGLNQVNSFLQQTILLYLPRLIVAVLMLLAGALIAEFLEKLVVGAAKAAEIKSANFAGKVTHWAIWIVAIMAALSQLNIAVSLINTLFTGIIVAVSLALGLSFGLGGQEAAARFIDKVKGEIASHHHQS